MTSINMLEKGVKKKKKYTDILPEIQGSVEITHLPCSCIIIIDSFSPKANFIIAWGFDRLFGQTTVREVTAIVWLILAVAVNLII